MSKIPLYLRKLYNKKLLNVSLLSWVTVIIELILAIITVAALNPKFKLGWPWIIILVVLLIIGTVTKVIIEAFLEDSQKELVNVKSTWISPYELLRNFHNKLDFIGNVKSTLYSISGEKVITIGEVTKIESMKLNLKDCYEKGHISKTLDSPSCYSFKVSTADGTQFREELSKNIGYSKSFSQKFNVKPIFWFIKVIRKEEKAIAVLIVESLDDKFEYYNLEQDGTVEVNDDTSVKIFNDYIDSIGLLSVLVK